jgi:hypothetical protein
LPSPQFAKKCLELRHSFGVPVVGNKILPVAWGPSLPQILERSYTTQV